MWSGVASLLSFLCFHQMQSAFPLVGRVHYAEHREGAKPVRISTDGYGWVRRWGNLALWPPCALEIQKAHSSHDAMCHSSVPFRTLPYPSVPVFATLRRGKPALLPVSALRKVLCQPLRTLTKHCYSVPCAWKYTVPPSGERPSMRNSEPFSKPPRQTMSAPKVPAC